MKKKVSKKRKPKAFPRTEVFMINSGSGESDYPVLAFADKKAEDLWAVAVPGDQDSYRLHHRKNRYRIEFYSHAQDWLVEDGYRCEICLNGNGEPSVYSCEIDAVCSMTNEGTDRQILLSSQLARTLFKRMHRILRRNKVCVVCSKRRVRSVEAEVE